MVSASAGPVSRSRAEALAKEFKNKRCRTSASLKCLPARKGAQTAVTDSEKLYVFNIGNNEGFVVVAGDDNAVPILGYADTGSFCPDNVPANMAEWLRLNELYVESCAAGGGVAAAETPRQGDVAVAPLLGEINWGQDYPFNGLCPAYTSGGAEKHYYTGCVATAATQIMKYYNYPQRGTGSKSYTFGGQELTADFGNTVYDWNNMLPFYPESGVTAAQENAAATLAAHFGIAVEMEYAQAGSGAVTMLVPTALREYFGYDRATVMRKRDYYSSSEWLEIIKSELDAGRPVYYGATSDDRTGGHAFVCDGYDTGGYVHINWGWYGMSNGFFLVNHLNPGQLGEGGGTGGYNTDQEIITGIQPEKGTETVFCRPMYSSTRLSCTDYGTDLTLITIISNYDTLPFDGEIAAALTSGGNVVRILKQEKMHVDGFADKKSGMNFFTMRDVPTAVGTGVSDGKYELRMVFRESADGPWQILRHPHGYAGSVAAEVTGGTLKTGGENTPHPDATILTPLRPDGDVYANGSALFDIRIRNNSKDFNLGNIVVQFRSVDSPEKTWNYENSARVYNESTEDVSLLVNLAGDMPAGEYAITLFENGYEEYPFATSGDGGQPAVTVLPASAVPVMRMTQGAVWRNATDTEIRQGDMVTIALGARNYGAPGKVGIATWLTDVDNPDNSYLFQQQNVTVKQGETVTATFYRKLPVDPGTYRVTVKYVTGDGQSVSDTSPAGSTATLEVGANTADVMLEAVALDFPDIVYTGENVAGSITVRAPQRFSGTLYLRARQHTITNGEIIYMGTQTIEAGEVKTVNFTYRKPAVAPGEYVMLVEAKQGGKEGTVGDYRNCYKLFSVADRSTGIDNVGAGDINGAVVPVTWRDGMLYIGKRGEYIINKVEIFNANGLCAVSAGAPAEGAVQTGSMAKGMYIARITTDRGTYTGKFVIQ